MVYRFVGHCVTWDAKHERVMSAPIRISPSCPECFVSKFESCNRRPFVYNMLRVVAFFGSLTVLGPVRYRPTVPVGIGARSLYGFLGFLIVIFLFTEV